MQVSGRCRSHRAGAGRRGCCTLPLHCSYAVVVKRRRSGHSSRPKVRGRQYRAEAEITYTGGTLPDDTREALTSALAGVMGSDASGLSWSVSSDPYVACQEHGTTLKGFLPRAWDHPVASDGTTRRAGLGVLITSGTWCLQVNRLGGCGDGIPGGCRD